MIITDNKEEIFDVVDENDNVTGTAKRGEVHGNNKLMHRSVGVVIFNSKGEIFLQQRSATKDVDPGKWTISCSGHVTKSTFTPEEYKIKSFCHPDSASAGKDNIEINLLIYEEAAHRELKEELRIIIKKPVTKFIYRSETEKEMAMIFRADYNGPFQLNKQEISRGKFFTRKELNSLIKSGKIDMSKEGKTALTKMGIITKQIKK